MDGAAGPTGSRDGIAGHVACAERPTDELLDLPQVIMDINADHLSPEFEPEAIEEAVAAFDRRTFLKVMGATLAATGMAGLGGCTRSQPPEKIVPYVRSPEAVV